MAGTIRFRLNENCSGAIAAGLEQIGVAVTTTREARLLGATDEEQTAYALAEGRVIFTQDADFLRINAAGHAHAGIASCEKDTKSVREILDGLILIWEVLEPAEMVGRVEFI
jgi:predicted nuclease of predicted toxin-antitoxin system